ncbi:MAG TPA: CYTH domain-containing protein [Candidatus Moranbacteria bacterium]|jgi:adenylate cyclase class 2|nr:CYTH domain-containing protein [Candidatus Moranbacteria bacterium]HPX94213.1 CYTH domain-containing protein [Candidatus Moranbacteria bacterium]HQB59698.1 CYTH domain-containing protein [Candidatus Moranbacteria bacterium]
MKIEYEAKFIDIDKDEMRKKLREVGAELVRPEFLQKRFNFHLPGDLRQEGAWLRVRDEGDKITLSLKKAEGDEIHHQKELSVVVNDFDTAVKILESIGCDIRMYQETKRELWKLNDVEITIDFWPFIEPLIEIEADSEEKVKDTAEKLGMDYSKAIFGPVGKVYEMKYDIHPNFLDGKDAKLVFEGENPFFKKK